jgi:hypothetical protein
MLNNPSSNVIEFPTRSQYDLFIVPGSDETVAASTGIVGIGVEMLHRPYRACGSPNFIITSSAGHIMPGCAALSAINMAAG